MDRFSGSFKDFLNLLKIGSRTNYDKKNNKNIDSSTNKNIDNSINKNINNCNNIQNTNYIEVNIDFIYEKHSVNFSLN